MPDDEIVIPPPKFSTIKDVQSEYEIFTLPQSSERRKYILYYLCVRTRDINIKEIVVTRVDQSFVNIVRFILDGISNIFVEPNLTYIKLKKYNYKETATTYLNKISTSLSFYDKDLILLLPFKYTKSDVTRKEIVKDMITRMCVLKRA